MTNTYQLRTCARQSGVTLSELMVGLAVSLILLTLISQIYVGAKSEYRYQREVTRLNEAGRLVLDLLAQDARGAGYGGCADMRASVNVVNNSTSTWWSDSSKPVRVYSAAQAKSALSTNAIDGSDALSFIRTDSASEAMIVAHNAGEETFTTASTVSFVPGDLLLATDCQDAAIFQMSGPTAAGSAVKHGIDKSMAPGNCSTSLGRWSGTDCTSAVGKQFSAGGLLARVVANGYFVAPAPSPATGNSLYLSYLTRSPVGIGSYAASAELVRGVAKMKITLGVEKAGASPAAYYYLPAENSDLLGNDQAISLNVELLLVSPDDGLASARQTYFFADTSQTAADLRLYRVFRTTIKLRNPLL
jgi:type IV pilus assembly protein PilW